MWQGSLFHLRGPQCSAQSGSSGLIPSTRGASALYSQTHTQGGKAQHQTGTGKNSVGCWHLMWSPPTLSEGEGGLLPGHQNALQDSAYGPFITVIIQGRHSGWCDWAGRGLSELSLHGSSVLAGQEAVTNRW